MSPQEVEAFFTRSDGSYVFARWGRPIVPVVFGVDDATLGVVKGAIEAVVALAGHIRIGDPLEEDTQMGPLCTQGQLHHIEAELAHAQSQGAHLICGGKQPAGMGGTYFEPTIIECPARICA